MKTKAIILAAPICCGVGEGVFVFMAPIQLLAYADSHRVVVIIGSAQWGLWMKCLLAWLLFIDQPPIPHRSPPPFQLVFPWTASQSSHALPGPRPQIAVGGRADPTAKLAIVTLRRMHRHTENVGENWEKAVRWRETGEQGIFHCFSQLPHLLLLSWTNCVDSHWKHPLFTPLSLLRGLETRNN